MIDSQRTTMGNTPAESAKSDEGEGCLDANVHDVTSIISGVALVSSSRQRSSGISVGVGEGGGGSLLSRSRASDPQCRRSLFRR